MSVIDFMNYDEFEGLMLQLEGTLLRYASDYIIVNVTNIDYLYDEFQRMTKNQHPAWSMALAIEFNGRITRNSRNNHTFMESFLLINDLHHYTYFFCQQLESEIRASSFIIKPSLSPIYYMPIKQYRRRKFALACAWHKRSQSPLSKIPQSVLFGVLGL